MLRKDYLVRQFEDFGKFMAIILGFRQQGKWIEHEEKVKETLKQFTALELLAIEDLSNDVFFEQLQQKVKLSDDQLRITADLLYEKAHYYLENNEWINAHNVLHKAEILFKYIIDVTQGNSFDLDVNFKLRNIKNLLKQIE
jgi:hypothetical protein